MCDSGKYFGLSYMAGIYVWAPAQPDDIVFTDLCVLHFTATSHVGSAWTISTETSIITTQQTFVGVTGLRMAGRAIGRIHESAARAKRGRVSTEYAANIPRHLNRHRGSVQVQERTKVG